MAHSIDPAAGAVRGFVPARNDEERYLMRHIEDLADAAFSRGIARYSAFLSDREQDLARAALGRAGVRDGWRFDGGWPEAERRVLCLEPEYSYGECPVRCVQLQCRALPGAALPAHKDYLGSLMGLALKREALGDILLPADAPGNRRQSSSAGSCVRRVAPRCPPACWNRTRFRFSRHRSGSCSPLPCPPCGWTQCFLPCCTSAAAPLRS